MGAVTDPGSGGNPSPEEVRANTEAAMKQVTAAAGIAQGMWRLLLADHGRHRVAPMELGNWREGVLPKLATRDARQRIDAARQRQETTLDVYVLAAFAGALAATGSSDAVARSLLDLACLHLDYPEVAQGLIQAADTDDVSERMHRLLDRCRAMIAERTQGQPDVSDPGRSRR